MQQTQQKDVREVVGFLRSPLPKLSKADRAAVKKILREKQQLDPTIALRMALCAGAPIDSEWLAPSVIDLALDANDITRNFEKLVIVHKLIHTAPAAEVLSRQLERAPGGILHALHKMVVPSRKQKRAVPAVVPSLTTAVSLSQIAIRLTSLLLSGEISGRKKRPENELMEVVYHLIRSSPGPEVAIHAIEFIRLLEKQLGWMAMEAEPMRQMRSEILETPSRLIRPLLLKGCVGDASLLREKVKIFDIAEERFMSVVGKMAQSTADLPLASRTWVNVQVQGSKGADASGSLATSDAAFERLALVLINAWESTKDGPNSKHSFSITEEVLRNGFNLFLAGEVGSVVTFDADVHESSTPLAHGDECQLLRPWVEWKSTEGLKILIRGRVSKIK